MKSFILALMAVMALTIGQAYATEVSAQVGTRVDTVSKQFTRVSEVRLQEDALGLQVTNSGTIGRLEADYAITPIASISAFQIVVGAGVTTGTSTVGHFTYSLQPRVVVPVTDKLTFNAGYLLRSDAQATIKDRTQVASIGGSYKLTQSVALIAKVEDSKGDYKYKQASIGASYSF